MYRLMYYFLLLLSAAAILLATFGILPYQPSDIILTTLYLLIVSQVTNQLFARLFRTQVNPESQRITALILSLIVGPLPLLPNLLFLTALATIAMASKYLLAWERRHVFNPAALAVFLAAFLLNQGASWWVGTSTLLPFVFIGGLIVNRKIGRSSLISTFLLTYLVGSGLFNLMEGTGILTVSQNLLEDLINSPLLFFCFVMLVEPLTSPQTKRYQLYYGLLVALTLLVLQQLLPHFAYSLELALLAGNLFTRVFSPDFRTKLKLRKKEPLTNNTISFSFERPADFNFTAGQFLEWTLHHPKPDSRGIRRYFTISSSPTEKELMLVTKFAEKSSSFKQALKGLKSGDDIAFANLGGEFTLPPDQKRKLLFIAGGIGVTPFRSMIKYLFDTKQKRDIVLLYSNRSSTDIVFNELFDKAKKAVGVRTIYTVTEEEQDWWQGRKGYIDEKMIRQAVPDYRDRLFYISGPEPMVIAFEKMLAGMGIARKNIKRDYFPGYSETHTK